MQETSNDQSVEEGPVTQIAVMDPDLPEPIIGPALRTILADLTEQDRTYMRKTAQKSRDLHKELGTVNFTYLGKKYVTDAHHLIRCINYMREKKGYQK